MGVYPLKTALKHLLLLASVLLLSGCSMAEFKARIGLLVITPFLLLIGVLWLLNRRGGSEDEDWEEGRLPDSDDDDDEDHFLM